MRSDRAAGWAAARQGRGQAARRRVPRAQRGQGERVCDAARTAVVV